MFDASYHFSAGAVHALRDGDDVTLVSTGVQTARVMEATDLLAHAHVEARVVHVPMLKPLDKIALLAALAGDQPVFTIEEHNVIGGLGGLVSEIVASSAVPVRVCRIGLQDVWSESAPSDFLLDRYGLSPARVADRVQEELMALSQPAHRP